MLKQVYEIESNGTIKEIYVAKVDGNGSILNEEMVNFISQDPPNGLYRPMWTGTKWIEGKPQAEFDEDAYVQSLVPSTDDIAHAEFEIKILNILMEVGIL